MSTGPVAVPYPAIDLEYNRDTVPEMPVTVTITPSARVELEAVPLVIRNRIVEVFHRLAQWPAVSGVRPLRGELHGSYRIRTGAWRVVFRVAADGKTILVWKIGNRGTIYD